jgi:multidrug efflux pump
VIVDVVSDDSFTYGQREDLMRLAEARLLGLAGVETLYTEIHGTESDLVGRFRLFLAPWQTRAPARAIGEAARTATADIAGLEIRVDAAGAGPAGSTPMQLEVIGRDLDAVNAAVDRIRGVMARIGDFVDVQDSRSSAGIEWVLDVDRREAARHGINLRTLERQLQLLTRGVDIGSFRPPDASETIDIRVRMVPEERNFEHLRLLRVATPDGLVPLANFATWAPEPRSGTITRVDQRRVMSISADVAPGVLVSDRVTALRGALAEIDLPQGVSWTFRGEAQRQDDAIGDLLALFAVGLVAMFTVLVLQFNSYRQALIMSMLLSLEVDVLGRAIVHGAPFTQYWVELSVAIVGGLIIATALTLVVTPAMLVLTRARAPRPAHPPVKDQTRPRVGHAGP